jgi:hypothetical protein
MDSFHYTSFIKLQSAPRCSRNSWQSLAFTEVLRPRDRGPREDLVGEFERDIDHELAEVSSWWWNQETQAALHRMVEQLATRSQKQHSR